MQDLDSADLAATATPKLQYDGPSILLHWLTAALVATQWTLGQCLGYFPKGAPREAALATHIVIGIGIAVVLLLRIAWRAGAGRKLPPADKGRLGQLAHSAHYGLYVLLVVTVALGFARAWLHGDQVFHWFIFSRPMFSTRSLTSAIGGLHGDFADILVILAGLHASAALAHHYVLRDSVLRRMLPGKRKARSE